MTVSAPTSLSLREIAAEAWARQQAEEGARRRQELADARDRLIVRAREVLADAFGNLTADPFSPYRRHHFQRATLTVLSHDDLVTSGEAWVGIDFAGERFEYKPLNHGDPHDLFHVWTCPTCGEVWEPPTAVNRIGSLADLGDWLERAPKLHRCEVR